jgi:hypothetical protein
LRSSSTTTFAATLFDDHDHDHDHDSGDHGSDDHDNRCAISFSSLSPPSSPASFGLDISTGSNIEEIQDRRITRTREKKKPSAS